MRKFFFTALCLATTAVFVLPAEAQTDRQQSGGADPSVQTVPTFKCADYRRDPDGSWTPIRQVTLRFPDPYGLVVLGPEVKFPAQRTYDGVPFARYLNEQCTRSR